MYMDERYKRRIRIEGDLDMLHGTKLHITDIDTGEAITNILAATIYLKARELNEAVVTYDLKATMLYAEHDEHGKPVVKDGDIVKKVNILDNPVVRVSAIERSSNKEQQ